MSNDQLIQKELCRKYGVPYVPAEGDKKVGIARNVRGGGQPINGLRHPPEGDACGWYIWTGEHLSNDPDFFMPLHVRHLSEWCPEVIRFLGLPPGYRFLVADGYEDIWEDTSLLYDI